MLDSSRQTGRVAFLKNHQRVDFSTHYSLGLCRRMSLLARIGRKTCWHVAPSHFGSITVTLLHVPEHVTSRRRGPKASCDEDSAVPKHWHSCFPAACLPDPEGRRQHWILLSSATHALRAAQRHRRMLQDNMHMIQRAAGGSSLRQGMMEAAMLSAQAKTVAAAATGCCLHWQAMQHV